LESVAFQSVKLRIADNVAKLGSQLSHLLHLGRCLSTIHSLRPVESSGLIQGAGRICRMRSWPKRLARARVSGFALARASYQTPFS